MCSFWDEELHNCSSDDLTPLITAVQRCRCTCQNLGFLASQPEDSMVESDSRPLLDYLPVPERVFSGFLL